MVGPGIKTSPSPCDIQVPADSVCSRSAEEKAIKVIYDHSAIKTPFYAGLGSWKGVKSTLGFIDYSSAAPTRNNLIQCFQNKNLATLVENIQGHVLEFTNMLRAKAKLNESVDGVVCFRLLALDVVTDVLWGEEKTLLSKMDEETPARHPESQRRLREELFGVFPNVNLVEPKKMTDLPLLDGVLKETMRMYPMIPGPLERYLGKEIELDGQDTARGYSFDISMHARQASGRVSRARELGTGKMAQCE